MPSENAWDEDHITLKEVHYNDDDTIIGICAPCTFADDLKDLALLKKHMLLAWDKPVMQESDLKGTVRMQAL